MKRLFIANRGEIAIRIMRAARELGIETILAVSEADRTGHPATFSDEDICVGPSPATKSYLSRDAMLNAAVSSGADAVHPGYGFLSEDASFARAVVDAGLIWVGPCPESIELMGNKAAARGAARSAGVPIMDGSDGSIADLESLQAAAERIGYPLMIKASAGGGGRGIRIVHRAADLESEFKIAAAEASAAFGDSSVYLERYIERARHVEVQILADGSRAIHLFDRDCSMQRRQQKVLEEAPAPDIPSHLREQMLSSAVRLAEACQYRGAGTVEYLYDADRGEICFIEMNTRLQVEHPVTEMITGIDLVREQLKIADGAPLAYQQEDILVHGHSIEARLCAENSDMNFMPSPGLVESVTWPTGPGVRIDSGVTAGSTVSPYYDSMLAKLIVWDSDRPAAIARLKRAIDELEVNGLITTKPFLRQLAESSEFCSVSHHTKFIEQSVL
ncbi:acetyl CoA carboxylase biotin carboxylase subunit (plasmid) [Rhodococcus jostii RHA1]|uniref:biotin carboxylase n=1 Tax=Rhodococcus jostii (strain RHA1) TaxID=101510 RepID=Q0RVU8_RHOJR|nr:acetyl-CoA carboxylase biotin carboxylase subunit [Rhodococcus jostii]ABH00588.1 acetyl CoA carboxylase biotin carboxylase subunit [Rhodococcus jostii RHA1]